jgi:hypothetical protein
MSTPTSPETPRSDGSPVADTEEFDGDLADESTIEPAERERGTGSLAAFMGGDVRSADVARLSDLDREAAAQFTTEWATLPEETRERIVRTMDELGEDRLDLAFGRVLRLALDDPSPVVRQLAITALWEDERQDLIEPLRDLLNHDPSQDVRSRPLVGWPRSPVSLTRASFRSRPASSCGKPAGGRPRRPITRCAAPAGT